MSYTRRIINLTFVLREIRANNIQINIDSQLVNYKLLINQMELLQSVITNSYPSFTSLLKFWLNQLLDIIINVFTTYPINVAVFSLVIFFVVYKILRKFFGDHSFQAKYKPLEHKQNFVNEVKNLKKEIREMQGQMI